MNSFEIMYSIFGSFLISAGLIMIITYTATNPWWRDQLGRMMITYASAEVIMSTLLMFSILSHISPSWFRFAWFALQTIVGCTFWFQTIMLIKFYRQRIKEKS